jgi:hypothetical protein
VGGRALAVENLTLFLSKFGSTLENAQGQVTRKLSAKPRIDNSSGRALRSKTSLDETMSDAHTLHATQCVVCASTHIAFSAVDLSILSANLTETNCCGGAEAFRNGEAQPAASSTETAPWRP